MKKENPQQPIASIDRNPFLVFGMIILTVVSCWWSYELFRAVSGWAFLVAMPAAVLSFHTLWMMLNPFALIYENKAELRPTWFHNRDRYFNDLTKIEERKNGSFVITYTDGEQERLGLFGIKHAHRSLLKASFLDRIAATSAARNR